MDEIITRLMRSHRLHETAYAKSDVEKKLSDRSEDICLHVLKCVVYKNTTGDFDHWYREEICSKLEYFSKLEVKTKSGKLKEKAYRDLVFKEVGETVRDAECFLTEFQFDYVNKGKYPKFKLTPELAMKLHSTVEKIKDIVCPLLAERRVYSKEEFQSILSNLMKELV